LGGSFDYDFTICFLERSNIAAWQFRRNLRKELQRKKLQRSIIDSTLSLPLLIVVFF
jgi:hypothetical protein